MRYFYGTSGGFHAADKGGPSDTQARSDAALTVGSLLIASALSPVRAADMTFERALNADKEPQNWLLHHKNFQGHRFSQLKDINTDTVKGLRLAFTVALGGMESGGPRYPSGNLEATPLVDDGIMYVTDGWGSVYAIDVSSGKKGAIRWKFDPGVDRAWAGEVACCGVNNRGVALWKDKVISVSLDGRLFELNRATGEKVWERKIADPAIGETITLAPLVIRDVASWAAPAASSASAASSTPPTSTRASRRGAPSRSPARASPATRRGRTAPSIGCTAAHPYG
jgi:alcohol dehydrogenase (cytochrome c)